MRLPTERAEAILPRPEEVGAQLGPPCAIMRDLGRAVTEAGSDLAKTLGLSILVLACQLHFLRDAGTDLLRDAHDKLRNSFLRTDVSKDPRWFAREPGRPADSERPLTRQATSFVSSNRNGDNHWWPPPGCLPGSAAGQILEVNIARDSISGNDLLIWTKALIRQQ